MADGCRIRFVGGPWHNRLVPLPLPFRLHMQVPHFERMAVFEDPENVSMAHIEHHWYVHCTFYSEFGTRYQQYVHSTLLRDGRPAESTYQESFPAFDLEPLLHA